ncbi:MAG: hypothetical protein H6Q74_2628 [Firmicutes bacterium]|nr:hypothetical protein [Bacillota bacterium]
MKNVAKKMMIYSLAGIMQIGFGTAVLEAAPYDGGSQQIIQVKDGDQSNNDQRRKHDDKQREENERHEREMRRHPGESDQEWHDRQDRENKRHNDALRDIANILIGIAIGSSEN